MLVIKDERKADAYAILFDNIDCLVFSDKLNLERFVRIIGMF